MGHYWTLDILETLSYAIDHFCELANPFASKANIMNDELKSHLSASTNKEWVKIQNVTLLDNKNDTALKEIVIPFLKNVSRKNEMV